MNHDPKRMTVLDGILMVGAILSSCVVLVFPLFVVPAFVEMYRDFGDVLPVLTRFVISGGYSIASLALVTVGTLGGIGLVLAGQRGPGRAMLVGAVGVALLVCAFAIMGLYLPLFQMAGAVSQ
jgi:type II secretory pathway component PulF